MKIYYGKAIYGKEEIEAVKGWADSAEKDAKLNELRRKAANAGSVNTHEKQHQKNNRRSRKPRANRLCAVLQGWAIGASRRSRSESGSRAHD